ncbi:MAG: KH domain-containing protein [Patescibacteria group bacterium]
MAETYDYQTILEDLLKSVVNYPESLKVQRILDEMGVLLKIKAHPQDMGLIVGRKGEMIKALRTIMRVIGLKHHARVNLKIEEPTQLEREKITSDNIIETLRE